MQSTPHRTAERTPHRTLQRILLIARRDYLATIRTKAFIIGLVVAPLLFGGGFLGVVLVDVADGGDAEVFAGEEFADHAAAAAAGSDESHAHGFVGFEGDSDHGFVGRLGGRLGW